MINRIIKGRGFRGVLDYLASRPGAEIIGGNMEGVNPRELAREFGFVRRLRPELGRAVVHLPLRLPPEESLSREQWCRVAERVLAGLGFGDAPYTLFRHKHEGGHHVHVVASRVTYGGDVISESHDYRRAMAILRQIEAEHGLRQVPCPAWRTRAAPARERRAAAGAAAPSNRAALQQAVGEAAAASGTVAQFLGELDRRGVQVLPRISGLGVVTGLRYRMGSATCTATGLGSAYTWPGLRQHFRLAFRAERDLPALRAAAARFAAADAPGGRRDPDPPVETHRRERHDFAQEMDVADGPDGPDVSPAAASGAAPSPTTDRTTEQVRQQLAALAGDRYDVLVLDPATGATRHARGPWNAAKIESAVPWLKAANAQGGEILVRPLAPRGYAVLAGVSRPALEAARRQGYQPASVVRAPDGGREVVLRAGLDVPQALVPAVEAELGRRFGAREATWPAGYAHLAGFTSPLGQGRAKRPPFLTLQEAAGRDYAAARVLIAACDRQAAEDALAQRVDKELARGGMAAPAPPASGAAEGPDLGAGRRGVAAAGVRLGLARPETSAAELAAELARLERAHAALQAVRTGVAAAAPTEDAQRAAVESLWLAAHREALRASLALAERTGVHPAASPGSSAGGRGDLAREALGWPFQPDRARDLVNLSAARPQDAPGPSSQGRAATAGARRAVQELPEGGGAQADPVVALAGRMAEAARRLLDREHAAASVASSREAAPGIGADGGAVWRAGLLAEQQVDAREAGLRAVRQTLRRQQEIASLAIEAIEPAAAQQPTPAALTSYGRQVERLDAIERALAVVEPEVAAATAARQARDAQRLDRLLGRPAEDAEVQAYRQVLSGRPEALAAADAGGRGGGPAPPGEGARALADLRAAVERGRAAAAAAPAGPPRSEIALVREVRAARNELRRTGDRLLAGAREGAGVAPAHRQLEALSGALERCLRAEAAWGAELGRPLPGGRTVLPGDLGALRERVLRGDLSAETLARMQRALGQRLGAGGPAVPPAADRRPAGATVYESLAALREDRAALLRAVRQLRPGTVDPLAPAPGGAERDLAPALAALRERLTHYQSSAMRLDRRLAGMVRGPEAQAIPPRAFLDHPAFAGRPDDAAAAWAAHALNEGVRPERLPRVLARARQAFSAAPGLFSLAPYGLPARAATVLVSMGYGMAREYAHTR